MVLVALQSVKSPSSYVRLDGNGVTVPTNGGGGAVNVGTFVGTFETFTLVNNDDGTVSFKSVVFIDVFLRLDGAKVSQGQNLASGGGVVNAQSGAGPYEKFKINQKANDPGTYQGIVGIESFGFPGRFLRLDAAAGVVNVQGVFETLEEFKILVVGQ
ncbi:hypothetical protein K443DRAFT_682957 [Laccaria amethystina LaAM-08-1]|jgi:hypothetical protein|uniref:Uncharacterized protein n=1 Tax=Laccaria amethystina LaAM-08-1 TaxID=1095629 RepID=A0A0C9WTX9_9AGAR|nr:hypothetical protein K443DRAFT_682957 [Laccaria amethystina LaAM-08-1]